MEFKNRPCETIRVTSKFGPRDNPTGPGKQIHKGIDISPKDKVKYLHEPIFACADGVVTVAGMNRLRGNQVLIRHDATTETRSQHMIDLCVEEGAKVKAGQVIGHMGQTGDSRGDHLHFEVLINGKPVNPTPYVMALPMPTTIPSRSANYKKVQAKLGFDSDTMEYLLAHPFAEVLFAKMLLPKKEQAYQVDTINYILGYKYGKEVFARLEKQ